MEIKKLEIDGFGLHRNLKIEGITEGLNIILGDNEAGKSTIKGFLSSVLFGFKSRASIKRYEPVNGGTHGGKITVIAAHDKIELSRISINNRSNPDLVITCLTDPAKKIDDMDLLKGINQNIYDNVFAFGTEELQTLKSLTDEEVMDYIYTAGFGFSKGSMPNLKKELNEICDSLWKPKGKKKINENIDKLTQIIKDKQVIQDLEEKYTNLNTRKEEINEQILKLDKKIKNLNKRNAQLEDYIKAIPKFKEYTNAHNRANRIQIDGIYTEIEYNSILNLEQNLGACKEEISEKVMSLDKIKLEKDSIHLDQRIMELQTEIIALKKEGDILSTLIKLDEENQMRREKLEEKLGELISLIGDSVDSARVEGFSITIEQKGYLRETVRVFNEKEKELHLLRREVEGLKDDKELLHQKYFKTWQSHDIKFIEDSISALYEYLKATESITKGRHKQFFILAIYFAILGIMAFNNYNVWPIIGVASLAALFPLSQWFQNTNEKKRIRKITRSLKVGTIASKEEAKRKIKELEDSLIQMKNHITNEENIDNKILVKKEKVKAIQCFLNELEFEKSLFLEELGLKKELSITSIEEVISNIEYLKGLNKELGVLAEQIESFGQRKISFTIKTKDICHNVGIDHKVTEGEFEYALGKVVILHDLLEEQKGNLNKARILQQAYDTVKIEHEKLLKKEASYHKEIENILTKGVARNIEEYKSKYVLYTEKKLLADQAETAKEKIRTIFLDGLDDELVKLQSFSTELLTDEKDRLLEELELANNDYKNLSEEKGKIANEIHTIEQQEQLDKLLNDQQCLTEIVSEDIKKWCTTKLAIDLLDLAIKEYEEKTQPDVFKKAEVYFTRITEKRYKKIVVEAEDKNILVINDKGIAIKPELLSRGTQEQLYICIRLGVIEEFCRKNGKLPVIFDDILVNFDDRRSNNAMEVIKEFSKKHQVLFFTCHKHLVNGVHGDRDVNVISL